MKRADFIRNWRRSELKNPDKPKTFIKKNVRNHLFDRFYPVLAKIRTNRGLLHFIVCSCWLHIISSRALKTFFWRKKVKSQSDSRTHWSQKLETCVETSVPEFSTNRNLWGCAFTPASTSLKAWITQRNCCSIKYRARTCYLSTILFLLKFVAQ